MGPSGLLVHNSYWRDARKIHSVYVSKVDDVIEYVGMTRNFPVRSAAQRGVRAIKEIKGLTSLTGAQARSVEQYLIERYGLSKVGGTLSNKINSIALRNPVYGEPKAIAKSVLKGIRLPWDRELSLWRIESG